MLGGHALAAGACGGDAQVRNGLVIREKETGMHSARYSNRVKLQGSWPMNRVDLLLGAQ